MDSAAPDDNQEEVSENCLICSNKPIAFQPVGCKHSAYCKSCAMKVATGGKCKVCGEKFFELQKI